MPRAKQKRGIQNPAVPLTGNTIIEYLGGGNESNAGIRVTAHSAMTVSPVWQAIDVITSDVSRLPFLTYRETDDGGKERAKDHPVYRLLRRSVGSMTANLWIARILGHALLYGNGYSRVIWRGSTVSELEWLHRDWVKPQYEQGRLVYLVQYPDDRGGRLERVPRQDMFHLVGLTLDDLGGLSLVDYARHTIGRQIAAETFGDDFFNNSAVPSGFFRHPGEMSEEAQKRFLAAVISRHKGNGNRWKPAILEEAMEYQPVGISPTDAMLIDQLKLGVMDVARFFNLPPHKLGDASRVNYNSLEAEEKAYYGSSLGKWLSRFEYEAVDKLFLDSEVDAGYFCEFLQDSWLKADTASRFNAYAVAINWGIMSRNEVRLRENLNPYDGGDEYLTPLTHAMDAQVIGDDTPDPMTEPDAPDPPAADPVVDLEPAARAVIAKRDELAGPLWDAARHLWRVCCRHGVRERNFLAFVNGLRIKQEAAVRGKLEAAFRQLVADDDGRLADAVTQVFEGVEAVMLDAAECQADQLVERVEQAERAIRGWALQLATDLVIPQATQAAA
jgi:HK97 family phage portal protein